MTKRPESPIQAYSFSTAYTKHEEYLTHAFYKRVFDGILRHGAAIVTEPPSELIPYLEAPHEYVTGVTNRNLLAQAVQELSRGEKSFIIPFFDPLPDQILFDSTLIRLTEDENPLVSIELSINVNNTLLHQWTHARRPDRKMLSANIPILVEAAATLAVASAYGRPLSQREYDAFMENQSIQSEQTN